MSYFISDTTIRAYAYDASLHCVDCAVERFGDTLDVIGTKDNEGNPIHPIFWCDELPYDCCDDCLDEL